MRPTNIFLIASMLFCENQAAMLQSSRKLSFELIAGFEPSSLVTDHNALDLDQKAMEEQLDTYTDAGFANAANIYTNGGHSKSYAVLQLMSALTETIQEGTEIKGSNDAGDVVTGVAYENASSGTKTLKFRYAVGANQESYSECQVGGLQVTNTAGCLRANGTLTVGSIANAGYTYIVESNNVNGRTLQGFSTSANTKMRVDESVDKEFYKDFKKFYDYYGVVDYSDMIVQAAFSGSSVTLNAKTFDFSAYQLEPRAEVVAKASAFLGVTMYVIRELEDSLDDCAAGDATRNADSVQALDEAVAFYTGSLEGFDGSSSGVFNYAVAEKRCATTKTCGTNGDQIEGNAKVNFDIFFLFSQMQKNLANKDCAAARLNKEAIAQKIFIPMIQGSLRYAYKESQLDTDAKAEAEGAIYAAAVLPIVAQCRAESASFIFEEMKPNSGNKVDFAGVKNAFESNYECMGVTCADVGGLYENGKYIDGAEPCGSSSSSRGANTGLAVGLSIGGVVVLALLFMIVKRQNKPVTEFKESSTSHV